MVTGASTGIGRACALHLANGGHRVFAGVRSEADAEGLRNDGSDLLEPVQLDVTRADHIDELVEVIASETDCLFGLVNNAGVARGGPVEYLPVDEWRDQFEVNVVGQVAVTRAMLPLLRRGRGRIVFMGSISGKVATMMMAPYDASKFAVEAIGESLRAELRPFGIRVSVIEPGAVKTGIWDKGRKTADRLERDLPAKRRIDTPPTWLPFARASNFRTGTASGPRRLPGPSNTPCSLRDQRPATSWASMPGCRARWCGCCRTGRARQS